MSAYTYCFNALIEKKDDGSIICPLIDCMGCPDCIDAWEVQQKYIEDHEEGEESE